MNGLSTDSRSRVEDYLSDKFQNVADLENIDSLLTQLTQQQDLLRRQLDDARQGYDQAQSQLDRESTALKERAVQHEAQQQDVNRRLQILTQSEVSDDAVSRLEEPMKKLRRIEVGEQFVQTLQDARRYEETAQRQAQTSPQSAVKACQDLQNLVLALEAAQPAAEGAAPHLLDQLTASSQSLFENLRDNLSAQLKNTLEAMRWPGKDLKLRGTPLEDWTTYTILLLTLQEPKMLMQAPKDLTSTSQAPEVLLPLAVMVAPLAQRFRYHYYGERPTNRLDHPEYYFRHTLDLISEYSSFMSDYLQPILDSRVQQNDGLDLVYTDATSSFITALLPMVSAKCLSIIPHLTVQPQLMSHFVREMMAFDTELKQTWAYSPFPGPYNEWKGLTGDILTKQGYFDAWLRLEKDFALSRYQAIVENSDSREIDYDGVESGQTKPTGGAIRVNDLLETITDRYRNLSSFSQKMKFLMDIQLSIFDRYHGWLNDHFQAYRSGAHTAGRMISGQAADAALGLPGLSTLVKVFGSAEYLERKMTDWSDDVFFLELWEELQDRASQNTGTNGSVGKDLNVEDVAARTSATIKNADEMLESDGGALFDETASAYRGMREASEAELVRLFQINARNAVKPMQNLSTWSSLSTPISDYNQLPPSSALDSFNQVMSPLLDFLSKTLAAGALRRVIKQMCHTLQEELYDRLLMKHSFSSAGASQLKRDLAAICQTIDQSIGLRNEAQRYFIRLSDAIALLSLPIKASAKSSTTAANEEPLADGWGFDEDDNAGDEADADFDIIPGDDAWGLWQAERAIFADNSSARKALESMELNSISETDARSIIRRRIEINS